MAIDSIGSLKRQLAAASEKYDQLESASNVQKQVITDLRSALLHLAHRTHPDSDGCDACQKLRAELKAAETELRYGARVTG